MKRFTKKGLICGLTAMISIFAGVMFSSCDLLFEALFGGIKYDDGYDLVTDNYSLTLGSSRYIFVDCDSSLSKYSAKKSTLRAIGRNSSGEDLCYVWVVDGCYSETKSSGTYVTKAVAQSIADKFTAHYYHERSIFGEESDYMLSSSGIVLDKDMKETSPTSTCVNIVIYDIGNDYNSDDECGVAGYFYSKDYFRRMNLSSVVRYSNNGKYFYIDAPFCNYNEEKKDYSGTGDVSNTAITTLFHEFQHMINFNQKSLNTCTEEKTSLKFTNDISGLNGKKILRLADTSSITLSNVAGKYISYVSFNAADSEINKSNVSMLNVSGSTGLTSNLVNNLAVAEWAQTSPSRRSVKVDSNDPLTKLKHFVPKEECYPASVARAAGETATSDSWYNEMLSMLAEDMMTDQLSMTGEDCVWNARLPMFNQYYWASGIDEYLSGDDENPIFSYSTSYAFGAWLARTYGGPEFVKEMSQNSYVNMTSIVQAVKTVTGISVTPEELYFKFIEACVLRSDYAEKTNGSTFNKAAGGSITSYGFTSAMNPIDIFSSDFSYRISEQDLFSSTGPVYFAKDFCSILRPHGFNIHFAGVAKNSDVTLKFTKGSFSSAEYIFVFVQDPFTNKILD